MADLRDEESSSLPFGEVTLGGSVVSSTKMLPYLAVDRLCLKCAVENL